MIENGDTCAIETGRLLLRKFSYEDTESMLRHWIANPAVQHNYGEPVYEDDEAVRCLLDRWLACYAGGDFYRWAVLLKKTGENIGQIAFCRLYRKEGAAEVECCIGEDYWGKGYVPEALRAVTRHSFDKLEMDRLEAFHRIGNPNSGRVLEKAGFKKVSSIRRFEEMNKQPVGEVCFALTREEYIAGRNGSLLSNR